MSVLFVCLGNICRSPTAEAVFRALCPHVVCDSAGTSGWHVGEPPYAPMQAAALARGYDLSSLKARRFEAGDFGRFDLIIGMDDDNLEAIEALRPRGSATRTALLAPFGTMGLRAVPDPYYTRDFSGALDIVEDALRGLIVDLDARG